MAYGAGMTKLSPCGSALVLPMLEEAPPQALLDAGCGRGERLRDCAALWPETALFGIDCDAENAAAAQVNCPRGSIVSGDVCDLPWEDGRFDTALCECTLSLLSRPEACLSELCRVLRPGGMLLLSDLCMPGPAPERVRVAEGGAVRFLASVGWHEAAAKAAGFHIRRYRDCREEYLTMAAQMIFDGSACCLGPDAFAALRQHRAGYGMWLMEKGASR